VAWGSVLLCVSFAGVVISLLTGRTPLGDAPPWQMTMAAPVYELTGLVMAIWAWRHPRLDRRSRRAWGLMAIAYAILIVSGTLRSTTSMVAFPTPADVLRLVFALVLLAGLLALPLRIRGPGPGTRCGWTPRS
jgi:membrane-anchored protein YejM (alkaline phosphatase superfamily)